MGFFPFKSALLQTGTLIHYIFTKKTQTTFQISQQFNSNQHNTLLFQ